MYSMCWNSYYILSYEYDASSYDHLFMLWAWPLLKCNPALLCNLLSFEGKVITMLTKSPLIQAQNHVGQGTRDTTTNKGQWPRFPCTQRHTTTRNIVCQHIRTYPSSPTNGNVPSTPPCSFVCCLVAMRFRFRLQWIGLPHRMPYLVLYILDI